MASACQLESEGGLNSHRTQYGLIDCTGEGTEFYGTQNARIITLFPFAFAESITRLDSKQLGTIQMLFTRLIWKIFYFCFNFAALF